MHRLSLVAIVALLVLAAGCGGSSSNPQQDASVQSDGGHGDGLAAQQDVGTPQGDGPLQNDAAAQSDSGVPTSHTESNGGVMHMPGKDDPKVSCTACHGASLTGGTGKSCYTCHNNDDHTINKSGKMHRSGTSSSCTVCHGPNNTGGLGPSCNGAGCH